MSITADNLSRNSAALKGAEAYITAQQKIVDACTTALAKADIRITRVTYSSERFTHHAAIYSPSGASLEVLYCDSNGITRDGRDAEDAIKSLVGGKLQAAQKVIAEQQQIIESIRNGTYVETPPKTISFADVAKDQRTTRARSASWSRTAGR